MILRTVLFLCIEIPLALCLGYCRAVAERPIVQHAWTSLLDLLSLALAQILSHPAVQHAAAPIVAEGVNEFLSQTERVEQHVRTMAATVSKTQPDWARKQGEDFPLILSSFFQGMVANMGKQQQQQQSCAQDETHTSTAAATAAAAMVMLNVSAVSDDDDTADSVSAGECKVDQ